MSQADDMRSAFDATFAAAPVVRLADQVDLLAVGLGGARLAIRLGEIAGLFADKAITPLPGNTPGLLGLAGFRGLAVPVYHLGALLRLGAEVAPRWMVLAAGSQALALAFDRFDGHVRVPPEAIAYEASGDSEVAQGLLRHGGEVRPVVRVGALVASIAGRARASRLTHSER